MAVLTFGASLKISRTQHTGNGRGSEICHLRDGDTLSFRRLQDIIEPTAGNLITHLRKLEDAGYLTTNKTGNGTTGLTSVALTADGRTALQDYRNALKELLGED